MVLGVIVAQVSDARLPEDEELNLDCAVAYQIKAHVDRFRSFLLDGIVGEAVGGGVVYLDFRGRLWVPQFAKYGAYWDGFFAVDVGGANLGFGGRTHHV